MKKIKSYLKQNYKKLIIQVVSIISCFVIFTVPCFATEYSGKWVVDVEPGENGYKYGGIYFRYWNSQGGKYYYFPTVNTYNGLKAFGCSVPKEYNTVSALFKFPFGDSNSLSKILGVDEVKEKFYLEFDLSVEIGNYNAPYFDGPFEFYLSQVEFFTSNPDSQYSQKFSFDYDIQSVKYSATLQGMSLQLGMTIVPNEPFVDLELVNFNFYIPNAQYDSYDFVVIPRGPIKIITGDDIPAYAPVSSGTIDKLDSVEQQLQSETQAGVDEAGKIFKNAGSVFGKTSVVGKSVLAATKIFNSILKVDVFDGILNVALTLGIFSFLLGLGGVGASLWNKYQSNKNSKSDD